MWLIIGLIVGVAILGLVIWLRGMNFSLKWYEWLIVAIGLLLLLFTIQNFVGASAELAPEAALMFLLVTGLPALLLFAVVWQLAARRKKAA